ncbi:hypothetical protein BCU07_023155, partial [Vibrio sp. 10N.261.54.E10]
FVQLQIWVFNRVKTTLFVTVFAFIVKRFRVFVRRFTQTNQPPTSTRWLTPPASSAPLLSTTLIAPIFRGRKRLKRPAEPRTIMSRQGTFVTAVVTGGVDERECQGVEPGDTTPMVFQTLNNGILPNGKPPNSKIAPSQGRPTGKSRRHGGIVRTHRTLGSHLRQ